MVIEINVDKQTVTLHSLVNRFTYDTTRKILKCRDFVKEKRKIVVKRDVQKIRHISQALGFHTGNNTILLYIDTKSQSHENQRTSN